MTQPPNLLCERCILRFSGPDYECEFLDHSRPEWSKGECEKFNDRALQCNNYQGYRRQMTQLLSNFLYKDGGYNEDDMELLWMQMQIIKKRKRPLIY